MRPSGRPAHNHGKPYIDRWSWVVMGITCILFAGALVLKGLTHEALLEAGVFLVSVKLIMMAYKNSVAETELKEHLDEVQEALERVEGLLAGRKEAGKE